MSTPRPGSRPARSRSRREQYGPNKFAEGEKEPGWQVFLRQYKDLMQIVLLVAGIVSIWPVEQYTTGLLLIGLTVLNAAMGMAQEGKAAAAVAALQEMMIVKARVLRDGELMELPAEAAGARRHRRGRSRRPHPRRRPPHQLRPRSRSTSHP